jgi:hypothetical protein
VSNFLTWFMNNFKYPSNSSFTYLLVLQSSLHPAILFGYPRNTGTLYLSRTQYQFTIAYPSHCDTTALERERSLRKSSLFLTKSTPASKRRKPLDSELPRRVSPIEHKRTSFAQHRNLCVNSAISKSELVRRRFTNYQESDSRVSQV